MHLYNLTLQSPTAAIRSVQGSFTGPRTQEIVLARGRVLELLRLEDKSKLCSIWSSDVFGIVRSITTFRLTGSSKDYLVLGSDSGRIIVLEYNLTLNTFEKVYQETFGKSGIRRIVPGHYLATDPKGRAVMIAAVERTKFVYVLNRDASNHLTISSPLEAHKSHQICFALTGIEVGFENPVFASIEQSYEACDKRNDKTQQNPNEFVRPPKGLSFWEMDLGLNHVIKKCTLPLDDTAHMLIPVPGGSGVHEGPSGVLVCCANYIVYKRPDHCDVACAIPRRLEMGQDAEMLVSCFAIHRLRGFFFFLIQTDYGDLYKIELQHEKQGDVHTVTQILIRYLDSIPIANSMCVLRSGYLFVASEFGNHQLYQFTGIGDDKTDPLCSSLHASGKDCTVAFKIRPLKNLALVDELVSFSPITDMKILDALNQGRPQLYLACGRGPRSSLKILQHGLSTEELADNQLPGSPIAVWTLKASVESKHDSLIVVAFIDTTLILSIGETVAEITDTDFLKKTTTLHVALMNDNSHIQVHENGIRHIQSQNRVNEWRPPLGHRIIAASSNATQICVSLSGSDLISFELDSSGTLTEACRRNIGFEVTSISLQPTPPQRARASFVAIGGLDNTVRILSIDPELDLRQLALFIVPNNAHAESLCLLQIIGNDRTMGNISPLYLFIGLETGVLLRVSVDKVTGELSDQRSRFLGPAKIKLHNITLKSNPGLGCTEAVAALCTRPWLCVYNIHNCIDSLPLQYGRLEYIASFNSPQCPDGLIAVSGQNLKIFQCNFVDEIFSHTSIPLTYTPRRLCVLPPPSPQVDLLLSASGAVNMSESIPPTQPILVVLEADHNVYDEATRQEISQALRRIKINETGHNDETEDDGSPDMELTDDTKESEEEEEKIPSEEQVGTFRAGVGKWGSIIRVVNPATEQTIFKQALEVDEAALCCCVCRFWEFDSPCLVVGTVQNLSLRSKKFMNATIKVFAYSSSYKLTLLHSTPIDQQPMALCAWEGRLIASLGKRLRIYSLGRKRLLKKCEFRAIPESIVWLRVVKDRIYAGDLREGFMILKYKSNENQLHVVAEEFHPHWLTCGEVLDYHTVIGGDKFDSISVTRVPPITKDTEAAGIAGNSTLRLRGDTAYLVAESLKFDDIAWFHLGETVTAIQKATLTPGGSEALFYTTILGSIGALLPLLTKDEVDLLQHLEMSMRNASPPLCGREHVSFRSYYFPCKAVIDGDLCEQYRRLTVNQQKAVALEVSKTSAEILKKLEELRNRLL